jgi:hypothetical protein
MSKALYRTGTFALLACAAACSAAATSGTGPGSSSEPVTGTCATPVVVARSLFVASVDDKGNPNALGVAALKDFSFKSVMDQIVATGAKGSKQSALELYDQMLDTLNKAPGDTDGPHCTGKINGFAVDCPRPEGALAATNPFTGQDGGGGGGDGGTNDAGPPVDAGEIDGGGGAGDAGGPPPPQGGAEGEATKIDQVLPVALVNRFDLAPTNGANCGEYRIVFAIPEPGFPVARFLMIFEAALPNPVPSQGLAACLPVAQFWDNLSASGVTQAEFTSQLKKFYFTGIEGLPGNPAFPPVIQAQNYGIGGPSNTNTGQIRVNMLSIEQWQLREFTLSQSCTGGVCTLTANNTFDKNNPFGALFQKGEGAKFQAEFISQVKALSANSIPLISMTTPNVDNAGQSSEQDDTNDYACQSGLGSAEGSFCSPKNPKNTSLSDAIQTELTKLKSSLTPEDIVQRATTQSCAGCHQLSPGTKLGGGLTWPASEGFTQVDEQGFQSTALTQFFLPFRSKVLTKFIDANCGGAEAESGDGTTTVGGQQANSSN